GVQVRLSATWREMYVPELTVAELLKQYSGQYTFYVAPILSGLPPQDFLAPDVPPPQEYPGDWAIPLDGPSSFNTAIVVDPPTAGDFARLTRIYPDAKYYILRAPTDPQP